MIPTHTGTHIGWSAWPNFRRVAPMVLAGLVVAAAVATAATQQGAGPVCAALARSTSTPDVRVTALPGVDLRPVMELPGVSTSSGPYPGVATSLSSGGAEIGVWLEGRPRRGSAADRPLLMSGAWARRGGVVVERRTARQLGLHTGGHVRVATTHGPLRLVVSGIAATTSVHRVPGVAGLAYVQPRDLLRVARAGVHGSTMFLRAAESGDSGAISKWLARRFPGPQLQVERGFPLRCGAIRR